ncbi:MAG: HAD-IC family P-type ATPase [Myxococcota bacterium]
MDRSGAVACACLPAPGLHDWMRLGLGVVISGQVMVLSLAINLSVLDVAASSRLQVAVVVLTLLGVALLGPELAVSVRRAWERGRATLEAMFALALAGGLGASVLGLLFGGPVFFEVVTVVLCVHAIGLRVKERFWSAALDRVDAEELYPSKALRLVAGELDSVDVGELVPGDLIVVHEGSRAAAGGQVVAGHGWIRTDGVDGHRLPIAIEVGARVPAGAMVGGGGIRLRVDQGGTTALHAQRAVLLQAFSTEIDDGMAGKLAGVFAPAVASIALVAGVGWSLASGIQQGFSVATAVLLVACPCGFGLATPVAVWAAAGQLARHGVRVRRPAALEALGSVGTVVLDKTGTLTELTLRKHDPQTTRASTWMGALQQWFDHPVAAVFWSHVDPTVRLEGARRLPSGGVAARIHEQGAWHEVAVRPCTDRRDLDVWIDGRHGGRLGITERIGPRVPAMIEALRALGTTPYLLTGDTVDPRLGIPFEGGASPEAKAARVVALREVSQVAFVGDRPNDLPAMASADVAIAAPDASAIVRETADLSLDTLSALPEAIRGARALRVRLRRLLGLSLVGNVIGVSAAAAGALHPVVAAGIMGGTSLMVTLLAVPQGAR